MKLFRILLVAALTAFLAFGISAKEVVVYENDFSSSYLNDLTLNGDWFVSDGKLMLGSGKGAGRVIYEIPAEYSGCRYKVEVDFIGHTSTGGIMVGATGNNLSDTPKEFHGYDCFLGNNGKKAALGTYKADGSWLGNFQVSGDVVTATDVHFSVEVCGDELTYNVTSLDGETSYFGISYKIGTSSKDIYSAFSNTVGLRKFYVDKGAFDNLKITVFADDKLTSLNKKLDFGGFEFKSNNGLKLSNGAVTGSGAMLSSSPLAENFKASVMLTPKASTKVLFGMKDNENGYAFEIDKDNEQIAFYQITDGKYIRKGVKNTPMYDGEHLISVEVCDKVATVTYDAFFEGEEAFKSFDFKLRDYTAGKYGVILNGGKLKDLTVAETDSITGETYVNPVAWGPDPDVLFYDGTYYLYNRITSGNDIFRVYTSPDLARWTAREVVFVNDPSIHNVQHYMSPNVCYYEGTFYLFYAAKNSAGSNRLFCATSDSPYGPFTHKHGQVPLHDVPEIGGHPYIDEDGKVYLSYVRFGGGNHIWLEEVILADDKATPVPGTLTKLISPTEDYEIDGHGFISEGGVITKHNGLYYMIWATGHYEGHYGEGYGVAENILGPYTKYKYNDILTWNSDIDGTGDAVFVKSPDGSELWIVYHKHYAVGTVAPRYTCIDKVKFVNDPNGGADILTVNGPSTTPQAKPSNIYRYDVNRDGVISLYDALLTIKEVSELYSGRYDADSNNRNDEYDAMAIIEEMVK